MRIPPCFLRLPVLVLALCLGRSLAAAPVAYQWREQEVHDVKTAAKADVLDIETAGPHPWVIFTPKKPGDAKTQFVLAFDYFCPEGIANLSVYYGEPWSEQRVVRGLSLPKAEGWQPFRVNLGKLTAGKFGTEDGTALQLDLGTEPKVRVQLRNVRVEAPAAEDLRSPEELRAEHERRVTRNQDVLDYLHADFACQDAAARLAGDEIRFTASWTGQEKPARDLFLAQFPIWSDPWLLMQRQNAPPASASGLQIESPANPEPGNGPPHFSMSVPRVVDGRDRLASRWALVEKAGEGYRLRSPAVYLDDRSVPSKFPSDPIVVTSKKGMGGVHENINELGELGVHSATVNPTPIEFFRLEPGTNRLPFNYQNHTYYFEEAGLAKYDGILKACADQKIQAALILLI